MKRYVHLILALSAMGLLAVLLLLATVLELDVFGLLVLNERPHIISNALWHIHSVVKREDVFPSWFGDLFADFEAERHHCFPFQAVKQLVHHCVVFLFDLLLELKRFGEMLAQCSAQPFQGGTKNGSLAIAAVEKREG